MRFLVFWKEKLFFEPFEEFAFWLLLELFPFLFAELNFKMVYRQLNGEIWLVVSLSKTLLGGDVKEKAPLLKTLPGVIRALPWSTGSADLYIYVYISV